VSNLYLLPLGLPAWLTAGCIGRNAKYWKAWRVDQEVYNFLTSERFVRYYTVPNSTTRYAEGGVRTLLTDGPLAHFHEKVVSAKRELHPLGPAAGKILHFLMRDNRIRTKWEEA
jgi:hypothetical protein